MNPFAVDTLTKVVVFYTQQYTTAKICQVVDEENKVVLTERTQRVLISPQTFINLKKTAMSVEPQPVNDVTTHLTH